MAHSAISAGSLAAKKNRFPCDVECGSSIDMDSPFGDRP